MVGNPREFALNNLFVQALHVVGAEGRDKCTHLVEDAAEGPDIALAVVGLVAPHLRTGIVGCSRLRVAEALLDDFADVEVAQLGLHVLEKEQVGTLHVAMQDAAHVERPQPSHDLNEDIPDLLLLNIGLSFLIVADFLEDVAVVSILHDQAQTRRGLVDKCVAIGNHVGVIDGGEDAHLVQGVFLFFLR